MGISDFGFDLPRALIAQHPPKVRGGSRPSAVLPDIPLQDVAFPDSSDYIGADDVLVFDNTKVTRARLFGRKKSGGRIEALIERVLDDHTTLAHVRSSKLPRAGAVLIFEGGIRAVVTEHAGDLFCLRLNYGQTVYELLEQNGYLPLLPYIEQVAGGDDDSRYQAVYTRYRGVAVVSTAGLHSIDEPLGRLKAKGVETAEVALHIGTETFQPVRISDIADHKAHSEQFDVPPETVAAIEAAQARGGRIWTVSTASMQALRPATRETGRLKAGQGDTDIFITPSYRFNMADRLITNFHLPKSALLMLVAASPGMEYTHAIYCHVVEREYRFLDYNGATLLGWVGR